MMALAVIFISRKSCKIYENVIKSPVFLPSFTKGTFPKMDIGRLDLFRATVFWHHSSRWIVWFLNNRKNVLNQISCSLFYLWSLNMFNWGKDRCSQRRFHFHLQSFRHKHIRVRTGEEDPSQTRAVTRDLTWIEWSTLWKVVLDCKAACGCAATLGGLKKLKYCNPIWDHQ